MSKFNFKNQPAPTGNPAAGFTFVYVDDILKELSSKDDAGNVINYGAAATITGANSGLIKNAGNIQFGQTIGLAGDPGKLLHDTEIPMDGKAFHFVDRLTNSDYITIAPGTFVSHCGDLTDVLDSAFFRTVGATGLFEFLGQGNGNTTSAIFDVSAASQRLRFKANGNNILFLDFGANIYQMGDIDNANNNTFFTINDTRKGYNFNAVQTFADNAAALLGGLIAGDIYRITASDALAIVH